MARRKRPFVNGIPHCLKDEGMSSGDDGSQLAEMNDIGTCDLIYSPCLSSIGLQSERQLRDLGSKNPLKRQHDLELVCIDQLCTVHEASSELKLYDSEPSLVHTCLDSLAHQSVTNLKRLGKPVQTS